MTVRQRWWGIKNNIERVKFRKIKYAVEERLKK